MPRRRRSAASLAVIFAVLGRKPGQCFIVSPRRTTVYAHWIGRERALTTLLTSAGAAVHPSETPNPPSNAEDDPYDTLDPAVYGRPFIERLRDLRRYKDAFGDCLVPKRYAPNPALGNFVNKQRQLYKNYSAGKRSSLTPERVGVLEQLGFAWVVDPAEARKSRSTRLWGENFEELRQHRKEHGNCRVDSSTKLGAWVATQRKEYRKHVRGDKSALTSEQVRLLDSLDFEQTTAHEDLWKERIRQLKAYKGTHGDLMVPINYGPNPSLAQFVSTQRKNLNLLKRGERVYGLTKERIQELDQLGFVWNCREQIMRKWKDL